MKFMFYNGYAAVASLFIITYRTGLFFLSSYIRIVWAVFCYESRSAFYGFGCSVYATGVVIVDRMFYLRN